MSYGSNRTFVISDTHFGHANIIKFRNPEPNGELIRPGFKSIQEHDEHIVHCWNATVMPGNRVYHLGDVGDLNYVNRLTGSKRLILGNHDHNWQDLQGKFKKVAAWRKFKHTYNGVEFKYVLTHFPIDFVHDNVPWNDKSPILFNIHGHIHEKTMLIDKDGRSRFAKARVDPRYINVSCEQINYTPVDLEDLIRTMEKRYEEARILVEKSK